MFRRNRAFGKRILLADLGAHETGEPTLLILAREPK